MKDREIVTINNIKYEYDEFYKGLFRLCENQGVSNDSVEHPAVAYPICHNMSFTITYGDYECIANCSCGHKMVIYDG